MVPPNTSSKPSATAAPKPFSVVGVPYGKISAPGCAIYEQEITKMIPLRANFIALLLVAVALPAAADFPWSEPAHVKRGRDIVVTYRASIQDGHLIVEAKHAPGWHTYSMDNLVRARARFNEQTKSGEQTPQTELPTAIRLEAPLKAAGAWKQTKPKDLSDAEILWFTWGFEETAYFAVPIERIADGPAKIVINGQACDASSCAMVDAVELTVSAEAAADTSIDLDDLISVVADTKQPAG